MALPSAADVIATVTDATDSLNISSKTGSDIPYVTRPRIPTRLNDIIEEPDDDRASSCGSWQDMDEDAEESRDSDAIKVDPIDYKGLCVAAEKGNIDKIREVLDSGADIETESTTGWFVLLFAIFARQVESVEYLLSRGASVHHRYESLPLLVYALFEGGSSRIELMQLLIDHGANPRTISGAHHQDLLHWASAEGHLEAVKFLLSQDLDIHRRCRRGRTPVILATENGHIEVVNALLEHGADLQDRSNNGGNLLIWAACHNHIDLVKFFMEKGLSIESLDKHDQTPLILAAHFGRIEMVNFLLEIGANPLHKNNVGETAILLAATAGHVTVVQRLVEAGCCTDVDGKTALDMAITHRKEEVIPALLEARGGASYPKESIALQIAMADRYETMKSLVSVASLVHPRIIPFGSHKRGKYDWIEWIIAEGGNLIRDRALTLLLRYALEENDTEMMKVVANEGCPLDSLLESGYTPLAFSVRLRNLAMVQVLLDAGADVSFRSAEDVGGLTPLDEALADPWSVEHPEIVRSLLRDGVLINCGKGPGRTAFSYVLEKGSPHWDHLAERMLGCVQDVNEHKDDMGNTLLHVAALRNREDYIDILLEKGADLESKDRINITPLLLAAQHSSRKTVSMLLDRGANINATYQSGARAIHGAAALGNIENLKLLLERGMDVECPTDKLYTPLACALTWGREQAAICLIRKGANVHFKTETGATALHFAARFGLRDITRELLKLGCEVDACETDGWTPLIEACASGHLEIVSMLLAKGADTERALAAGNRPLHVAILNEEEEIAELLIEHGADVKAKAMKGRSALHLAAEHNLAQVAKILIERGLSTEDIDDDTLTPLCLFDGTNVTRVLLRHGANVNYCDKDNWNALHHAVQHDAFKCAKLLLHAGIDLDVRTTDDGLSVWERAEDMTDEEASKQWLDMLNEERERRKEDAFESN